jgi:hypothetical protein
MPRIKIVWMMAIIVIAAIDLAAIRATSGMRSDIGVLIIFGSMPMASILVRSVSVKWHHEQDPTEPVAGRSVPAFVVRKPARFRRLFRGNRT